jgi:hypothetical protein
MACKLLFKKPGNFVKKFAAAQGFEPGDAPCTEQALHENQFDRPHFYCAEQEVWWLHP